VTRRIRILIAVLCLALAAVPAAATTETYMLPDHWGGTWADAEKASDNTEDDLMCWAAAAANVLEWTGWGVTGGMTNTDEMFAYFQDHWTDEGGNMYYGWDWWFDGTNDQQGESGWAQVDVPGGGFYPSRNFLDYHRYDGTNAEADAMADIDAYLRAGCGVALAIDGPTAHAVTCWGFDYDPATTDYYTGLWLTDSDDSKGGPAPRPDSLRHYGLQYTGGAWHLVGYGGDYRIIEVQGLERSPIPEPVTTVGLLLGGAALTAYSRRRRSPNPERRPPGRPAAP
jgi:hypothetical protein